MAVLRKIEIYVYSSVLGFDPVRVRIFKQRFKSKRFEDSNNFFPSFYNKIVLHAYLLKKWW